MNDKNTVLRSVKLLPQIRNIVRAIAGPTAELSDRIAALAEPPMREVQSCRLLEQYLDAQGFEVDRPWKGLPTAFHASKGRGRPILQIMAEYDALPDCGREPGTWGHGCGHNLLGAGAAMAGAVAAAVLEEQGLAGRIEVIGTPAEETLGGKVFMGEAGAFDNADAVLAWHPGTETCVDLAGLQAMDSTLFEFSGKTAHAAGSPHKGRSALDAAMLMDIAVNYLREHVEDNVRMHCVILEGGKAPNVVPDRAVIWYYIRGRDRRQVDDLRRRVGNCAKAAALATETAWRMDVLTCCTERLPNHALAGMLEQVIERCGTPAFTPGDIRQAQQVSPGREIEYRMDISPTRDKPRLASSDEDNVSWFAPLGKIWVACVPKETVNHHRDLAALAVTEGAHRGLIKAGEMLAMSLVELAVNKPLLAKARAEFAKAAKAGPPKLPLSKRAVKLSQELAMRSEVRV